ncbi:helix-hairpin-helix domain-containing protein [Anoxynatronum sibiricum]|uniref:Helix-hairpin-helix domain-containing protein n=1 Tax=Anoxynatronum sibiricum TaxID=210623 RepID=A0ABU9VY56_9CLOT
MALSRQHKWIFIIGTCLLFVILGLYQHYEQQKTIYILSEIEKTNLSEQPQPESALSAASAIELEKRIIMVHIEGMIQHPGVYELEEEARLIDLVHLAGGLREGAAKKVNLAQKLHDEAFVFIPSEEEFDLEVDTTLPTLNFKSSVSSSNSQLININTADQRQLETLPGIGPVLAERIVNYREQHGLFKTLLELKKVSGIGDKKFQDLESSITI